MLRLQEFDVFLLMGSAIAVAAIGVRLLRAASARALVTKEPIAWKVERPQRHHILGSLVFVSAGAWRVRVRVLSPR